MAILTHHGYCPACGNGVEFSINGPWLRDQYVCTKCGSIPRQRALMKVLEMVAPNWRERRIHESSPITSGASARLAKECKAYVSSQYFPDVPCGQTRNGVRSENLEKLSFSDGDIDIHISQDVFEHIFDPAAAFAEIARTLSPGGLHVFTTPLVHKAAASECCATISPEGNVCFLRKPEYHGNPISSDGSLVTWRWGYDICNFIHASSGLFSTIYYLEMNELAIKAEFIEVIVTRK